MATERVLYELRKQINNVDSELDVLRKAWAQEIKALDDDPKFDPYKKKGEKQLMQVAEKYVDLMHDAEDRRSRLIEEYNNMVDQVNAQIKAQNEKKTKR